MKNAGSGSDDRIMLVTDRLDQADTFCSRPGAAGYEMVAVLSTADGLLFQIEQKRPDVVLIDLAPAPAVLDSLSIINRHRPTAIAMSLRDSDPLYIHQAVAAGICTYLPEGLNPARLALVIRLAIEQFRSMQLLRDEVASIRTELEERRHIDRAKRLLMQQKHISENAAHQMLLRLAMNNNQRLPAVARTVVSTLSGPQART